MRTPAQIRREAARARLRAELLAKQREDELRLAELLEHEANEREKGLTAAHVSRTVTTEMLDSHRAAISAARKQTDRDFGAALNVAGYSVRSLAAELDVSPATVHAHRKPPKHRASRPIPAARAARVRQLTGWPDDAAHWPAGIAGEK